MAPRDSGGEGPAQSHEAASVRAEADRILLPLNLNPQTPAPSPHVQTLIVFTPLKSMSFRLLALLVRCSQFVVPHMRETIWFSTFIV